MAPLSEVTIPVEAKCPEDITAVVEPDKSVAHVSWQTPYGVITNMTLQLGEKKVVYILPNGTECHLTISVISK